MHFWDTFLLLSILSCTLVTGFIFTYAVVIMPGFSKLDDKEFLRAFQVTDGVIQNNQPLFMLTWIGSIISIFGTIFCAVFSLDPREAVLIVLCGAVYLLGVQGITMFIHLPLNNKLQKLGLSGLSNSALKQERSNFEGKWNFYNKVRTAIAFSVSLLFLVILTLR
jgi:uncharacterized membrane protein